MFKNINFITPTVKPAEYLKTYATATPTMDVVDTFDKENSNYCKLVIKPLERGFGQTIGNSLRRVLLSSIPGAAPCAIQIEGVEHEFCGVDGVIEDVTEIILNVKNIVFTINSDLDEKGEFGSEEVIHELVLDATVPSIKDQLANGVKSEDLVYKQTFCAKDLVNRSMEIIEPINQDAPILTLNEGHSITMSIFVRKGVGYVSQDENKRFCMVDTNDKNKRQQIIGRIAVDSIFTPVTRCRYEVEGTRHLDSFDYDQLTLEVWTNGSIKATDAVSIASVFLIDHFKVLASLNPVIEEKSYMEVEEVKEDDSELDVRVEELDLQSRAYNALLRANIRTIGDLIDHTEEEMIKLRGLGRTSLKNIIAKLAERGLSLKSGGAYVDLSIEDSEEEDILNRNVDELGFGTRILKILTTNNIVTVADMVDLTRSEFIIKTNLGTKMADIDAKLANLGVQFASEEELDDDNPDLDKSILALEVNKQCRDKLQQNNMTTLRQVCAKTEAELKQIGFTEKQVDAIIEALDQWGLSLKY